jgi:hypothetical protein
MANFCDLTTKLTIMTLYVQKGQTSYVTVGLYGFNASEMRLEIARASGAVEPIDSKKDVTHMVDHYWSVVLRNVATGDHVKLWRGPQPWTQPLPIEVVDAVVATGTHEACPAVVELKNVLATSIPFLNENYTEGTKSLPRLQLPSDGNALTRHTAGLALDIILFKNNPLHRALAHHLFKTFLEYKHRMNWLGLIYEHTACNKFGQPLNYTKDDKHDTHIHIDWLIYEQVEWAGGVEGGTATKIPWPAVAHTTGFGSVLSPVLKDLNQNMSSLALLDLPKLSGIAG